MTWHELLELASSDVSDPQDLDFSGTTLFLSFQFGIKLESEILSHISEAELRESVFQQ